MQISKKAQKANQPIYQSVIHLRVNMGWIKKI